MMRNIIIWCLLLSISTLKAQESRDLDKDGIVDSLDIDHDNDGIINDIEGYTDRDEDGIPNAYDLDSDNDGILDNTESQSKQYYKPLLHQDLNKNGLDDAYDPDVNQTIKNYLKPIDSDNSGIADYLEKKTLNKIGVSKVKENTANALRMHKIDEQANDFKSKSWYEKILDNTLFWIGLAVPFFLLMFVSIGIKRKINQRNTNQKPKV